MDQSLAQGKTVEAKSAAWVYIRLCSDGSYYVGSTGDLVARLEMHQSGNGPTFTANRLPVQIVYSEGSPSTLGSITGERTIKRWSRGKKLALIAGDARKLNSLSRSSIAPVESGSATDR